MCNMGAQNEVLVYLGHVPLNSVNSNGGFAGWTGSIFARCLRQGRMAWSEVCRLLESSGNGGMDLIEVTAKIEGIQRRTTAIGARNQMFGRTGGNPLSSCCRRPSTRGHRFRSQPMRHQFSADFRGPDGSLFRFQPLETTDQCGCESVRNRPESAAEAAVLVISPTNAGTTHALLQPVACQLLGTARSIASKRRISSLSFGYSAERKFARRTKSGPRCCSSRIDRIVRPFRPPATLPVRPGDPGTDPPS
jgi:hypothetical protein